MKTRITALDCFRGHLPFKQAFSHSSAMRDRGESVFVRVTGSSGRTGIGEGCPRKYVTNEDINTASRFLGSMRSPIMKLAGLHELQDFELENRGLIDANPSAWCALELALLDLFSKQEGVNVESMLGLSHAKTSYQYSAVLGTGDLPAFTVEFDRYQKMGFSDYKVKLSGDLIRDNERSVLLSDPLSKYTLRADANNLWGIEAEAVEYLGALNWPIHAIEEPLRCRNISALAALQPSLKKSIILDESLTRLDQVTEMIAYDIPWIANIRVSKMGGLLRSLELVKKLKKHGIDIIVGAHVGETSLLSRVALVLADAAGTSLVFQEGAFGEHLLRTEPMNHLVQFGEAGILDAESIAWRDDPGFGLSWRPGFTGRASVRLLH
jgi:L-alanine-DL-glutamate epimerase-like enolase superfamily enzyme